MSATGLTLRGPSQLRIRYQVVTSLVLLRSIVLEANPSGLFTEITFVGTLTTLFNQHAINEKHGFSPGTLMFAFAANFYVVRLSRSLQAVIPTEISNHE